jgi:hypothetical protein
MASPIRHHKTCGWCEDHKKHLSHRFSQHLECRKSKCEHRPLKRKTFTEGAARAQVVVEMAKVVAAKKRMLEILKAQRATTDQDLKTWVALGRPTKFDPAIMELAG